MCPLQEPFRAMLFAAPNANAQPSGLGVKYGSYDRVRLDVELRHFNRTGLSAGRDCRDRQGLERFLVRWRRELVAAASWSVYFAPIPPNRPAAVGILTRRTSAFVPCLLAREDVAVRFDARVRHARQIIRRQRLQHVRVRFPVRGAPAIGERGQPFA